MLVKRDVANRVLALAQRVASANRPSKPLWAYLRLEGQGGNLVIRAASGETDLEVRLPVDGEAEFAPVLVPGVPFIRAVESAPGEEEIVIMVRDGHAEIRAWPWRASLNTASPEGFPEWPSVEARHRGRLKAKALGQALFQVRYAVSKESWRAIFQGLQLEFYEGGFRAVASDGYRLAIRDTGDTSGQPTLKAVLPARAADDLVLLLREAEGEVDLETGGGSLSVSFAAPWGEVRAAFRLMEGEFPDYERVIPKEFPLKAALDVEPFREALKRVSVMADKQNHRVDLSLEGKRALLSAEGDYGKGQEEIFVSLEGTPMTLAYDARHLLDALSRVEGEVVMRFSGQFTPTLIEPADGGGYRAVVVPLKV
jgi:DNA polymerase-3 subunit beta